MLRSGLGLERPCVTSGNHFNSSPTAKTSTMINFFAYGTLQLPEVMLAVTERAYSPEKARLDNFARFRLRGKSFPGIRPKLGASVDGILYRAIDTHTLQQLDAFEDVFYHRESVKVISSTGIKLEAETYVINEDSHDLLLPEAWDLEDFRRNHLQSFLLRHE